MAFGLSVAIHPANESGRRATGTGGRIILVTEAVFAARSGGAACAAADVALTSKGRELFEQAAQAWTSYSNLNPPKPNLELAKEMVRIYGEGGLNQAAQAVQTLQTIVAAEPKSASWYSQLAIYAYRSHNISMGDLASEKAVSLAPEASRKRLKNELAEVKANPSGEKTYTTTTNGKTYTGKLNAKGELKATEVKTTPTSTGKTSTTGTSTTTKKK